MRRPAGGPGARAARAGSAAGPPAVARRVAATRLALRRDDGRRLSGLSGIRDLLGDLLRRRLAGEQLLDRVVDRLPDRRRVRLVEVELHERRLAARVEHGLHVRVGDRALGALGDRAGSRRWRRPCWRSSGLTRNFDEVDRLGRRVLADGEAVAAAELLALLAGAAVDRAGTGTSRGPRRGPSCPSCWPRTSTAPTGPSGPSPRLPLPIVRGLAAGAVPRRGQEALLERLHVDELLELARRP